MVNFGLLAAEIVLLVWSTQLISTGFASWQRYCTALVVGVSQTAAFNRGRHLSAGRPSGWALAHISSLIIVLTVLGSDTGIGETA